MKLYRVTVIACLYILSCFLCHAQNSELYIMAMFNMGVADSFMPHNVYEIELSSDSYSYKGSFRHGNNTSVYKDVPQGPIAVKIGSDGVNGLKPFLDTIVVHEGINAIIIEMDYSGEHKQEFRDNTGTVSTLPQWVAEALGTSSEGTYMAYKPARPRMLTIDGYRALDSGVFSTMWSSMNPAIEIMEKNGWTKLYSNPEGPVKHALILLDPDVHWSWKNGAYVFWKDAEN